MESSNEAQFVDLFGDMWIEFGYPRTRIPMLSKPEFRCDQFATTGAWLLIILLQSRLVLERIHMRHRSFHKQEDDTLHLCWKVRSLGSQRPFISGLF